MEQAPTGPPTDKFSQRFLKKLPDNKLVRKLRETGELAPDERVIAGVPWVKVSPAFGLVFIIGVLPGLLVFLLFQRTSYLLVTDRRVLVTRWSLSGTKAEGVLKLNRPVHLALSEIPKRSHFFGNKVRLPQEIAAFLGRDTALATAGLLADYAFREARGPAAAAPPA